MPYNVPKHLHHGLYIVLWNMLKLCGIDGIGVIHGAKYPEFTVQCAIRTGRTGN